MPALPIHQIIFYVFAVLLLAAALMVIISRNSVYAALFLVLTFFCGSVLWMLLQAEFLSLVLIFVYVGAVMTLFLFVVMMINVDMSTLQEGFVKFLPYALLVIVLLVGAMWLALSSPLATSIPESHGSNYSNTQELGILLYTRYFYPFELAGIILLVAIIAAISLAFHGRKHNTKSQRVAKQLQAKKSERLRIINMKVEQR